MVWFGMFKDLFKIIPLKMLNICADFKSELIALFGDGELSLET